MPSTLLVVPARSQDDVSDFEEAHEPRHSEQDDVENGVAIRLIPEPVERTREADDQGRVDGDGMQRALPEDEVIQTEPEDDDRGQPGQDDGTDDVIAHAGRVFPDDSRAV